MARIISIHSFRGGTGKSNATANIATLMAAAGQRVGVVDTDIQSPGIHVLFGLAGEEISYSLNDYLWEKCDIRQAVHDVTSNLDDEISGRVFLIPSSIQTNEIVNVLREGYDVGRLTQGFRSLIQNLNLDVLMVDTHPGLNEETLFSIAISDTLVIIMRPDQQDYEGTGVTLEVARTLEVPRIVLVVNKTPAAFDSTEIKSRVEATYNCEVAAVLPLSDEMVALASSGIFVLAYPDHPWTSLMKVITDELVN